PVASGEGGGGAGRIAADPGTDCNRNRRGRPRNRVFAAGAPCRQRPRFVGGRPRSRIPDLLAEGLTLMAATLSPLAGKPAPAAILIDVDRLVKQYEERKPDPANPLQRVSFGTSGHRGSPLN